MTREKVMESATKNNLFATQAAEYSRFRPHYPDELFSYLSSLVEDAKKKTAWDVGTGNGQAAVGLAPYFSKVIATDATQKQLDQAAKHPSVFYLEGQAEKAPIESHSISLTTVAQALHWFHLDPFFEEVKRCSTQTDAFLAFWCYGFAELSKKIEPIFMNFYKNIVGPYWEPERALVENGYSSVDVPFQELTAERFVVTKAYSLEEYLGYLATWSATQTLMKRSGRNPVERIRSELTEAWGDPQEEYTVRWPLALRVFKVS